MVENILDIGDDNPQIVKDLLVPHVELLLDQLRMRVVQTMSGSNETVSTSNATSDKTLVAVSLRDGEGGDEAAANRSMQQAKKGQKQKKTRAMVPVRELAVLQV